MQNNHEISPRLLKELEQSVPDAAAGLSQEKNERICALALEKLRAEQAAGKAGTVESPGGAAHTQCKTKKLSRGLRIGLIAVALACVGTVSVCAVVAQLPMVKENIGFFHAPSQQQVKDPMDAPRGTYQRLQPDVEGFNALVGTSVTDNGITLTLDSISMDVSGMDLFMTITGKEAIRQALADEDYSTGAALWNALGSGPAFWLTTVNGKEIVQFNAVESTDWYLAEDGSLKLWQHYMLTELPEGDQIEINLKNDTDNMLNRSGKWELPAVVLDGKSVRTGGFTAQAVDISVPYLDETCAEQAENFAKQHLNVKYLAFGPKGGVISTECSTSSMVTGEEGDASLLDPENFMFTDDTGTSLFLSGAASSGDTLAADLSAPASGASSITLTPVKAHLADEAGNSLWEDRTVTSDEMRTGVKLETNSLGGYTVQNYQVKNGSITYELVPYGYPSRIELIPQEEGKVTMKNGHSGLESRYTDPRTGTVSVRIDYYQATQEELESIAEWEYSWCKTELDAEHAVTLPLQNVQP